MCRKLSGRWFWTRVRMGPIFFFRAMELRQRGLRTEIELHREDLLAVNSFSAPYIVRISSVCVGPQPTGGRGCASHRACKTRGINSNVRLVVHTCIHLSKIQFRFDTGYTIMLGNWIECWCILGRYLGVDRFVGNRISSNVIFTGFQAWGITNGARQCRSSGFRVLQCQMTLTCMIFSVWIPSLHMSTKRCG